MSDKGALYRELLPLLDSPLRKGERIWSYCPTHPDGQSHGRRGPGLAGRSLSLHPRFGLDCFASRGCTFEGIVKALRAKAPQRKEPSAEQVRDQAGAKGLPPNAKLVAAYEYRNPETGELLAIKGRFQWPNPEKPKGYDKTFRWRLPEGTYAKGFEGRYSVADMPLWKGEEVMYAPDDVRVWFVEGEEAVKALVARGEMAVCGAWSGSQKEMPATAFEPLRGKDVILWPDNDELGLGYMAEVRKRLRGIARTVTTVRPPVPLKGDAVDYFARGGTIEDLLANTLTRPTVDVLSNNHFVVRIPTDIGVVSFDFDGMVKSRGALDCELTVRVDAPGAEPEPYSQRINLKSHSSREALQRALGAQFGKEVNWTTVISTAYSRAEKAFLDSDFSLHISELPLVTEKRFTIEKLLPRGQSIVLFGNGKSGKSYLAKAAGLAIAMGGDFCGLKVEQGPVLYIDYETSNDRGEGYRLRITRLVLGLGLDPLIMEDEDFPMRYWPGRGVPLWDQVEGLKRTIARYGISTVIVDSAGPACGGEPEKAASAIQYFNALAQLECTSITIAHTNREDAKEGTADRPFGSVYWSLLPRRTWFVKRAEDENADAIDVAMVCKDINDGRRPKPLAFRLEFDGTEGPVRVWREDFRQMEVFDSLRSPGERVLEFLKRVGAAHIGDIVSGTGLDRHKVHAVLSQGQGTLFTVVSSGRGKQTQWAVLAD